MAVVVETRCRKASQSDFHSFYDRVEQKIGTMGGPPAGLKVAVAMPDGDGFVLLHVWRTGAEMREFYDGVVAVALDEAGLNADPPLVSPLWGLAQP